MNSHVQTFFIKPGELLIIEEEALITTVLGSCVSLILYNARTGLAGFCHAVFPKACPTESGYRFVDQAFCHLLNQFVRAGISRAETSVQLYGGADMFMKGQSAIGVGRKNIAMAHDILRNYNLRPVVCNTGGLRGRKLMFHTNSGRVKMDFLNRRITQERSATQTLTERPRRLAKLILSA
ncbi:MAG: chemotaxis protein CheD [Geopsychrobacter sp.]|nr:chemotaxis protein CheD [Geopsychrobacter sp.]